MQELNGLWIDMVLFFSDDLHVPNFNTSTFKKSVINMGIKLYNILSLELRKLEGFKEFKHTLNYFY
jgi:hypothetical protein